MTLFKKTGPAYPLTFLDKKHMYFKQLCIFHFDQLWQALMYSSM